MKGDFQITVIFDPEIIIEAKSKAGRIIYSKNPDEKKKNKLIEKLEKKAAEDSLKYNRRRLSSLFTPVFAGCIIFSGGADLTGGGIEDLIGLGDALFGRVEENFGIDIVNYSLIGGRKPNFFDFEVFNYNFDTHKAVKSEFVKTPAVKKLSKIAEAVLTENKPATAVKAAKKALKPTEGKPVSKTVKQLREKPEAKPEEKAEAAPEAKIKPAKVKAAKEKEKIQQYAEKTEPETKAKTSETGVLSGNIAGICETEYAVQERNISEEVDLMSLNWSLLSPSENIPVLEVGEPAEISGESSVRIYFQKPSVRQVVWRFRKKPESQTSKPILRVYKDTDMLWYDVLDGRFGSRYIIFPEGLELSQTWVEIGYLTERGDFIFIARSPVWPPSCLSQKLPKLKMERKISKATVLIGATESIPGGKRLPVNIISSGSGFSGSAAGITASGEGIK
ncbi:MAG: hypothetical protein M0034_00760 [Deltaproteobacteria bacterium]|nr:hypothetical protein [Deltaproteobacteria bacterium]